MPKQKSPSTRFRVYSGLAIFITELNTVNCQNLLQHFPPPYRGKEILLRQRGGRIEIRMKNVKRNIAADTLANKARIGHRTMTNFAHAVCGPEAT
jgi:hypothetical protein